MTQTPTQPEREAFEATMRVSDLMDEVDAARARRADSMPTEKDAIRAMFQAFTRLQELGWREGRYMPTNGERHAGIQVGSTGIHAYYATPREDGFGARYEIHDGDIWPTGAPIMFREWRQGDVQPQLRICAPIPQDDAPCHCPACKEGREAPHEYHLEARPMAMTSTVPLGVPDTRTCTCHRDDNPPKPCPRKFALSECRAAAAGVAPVLWENRPENLGLASTVPVGVRAPGCDFCNSSLYAAVKCPNCGRPADPQRNEGGM